jgi:hypothetical protein
VASEQDGLVSLDQLRQVEVTPGAASRRAARGRLHRMHRGVYAVGHRATGRNGLLRGAILACGEGALISHGTAAAFWGLRDVWPSLIDVTVPCEAGRKIDGIRCHRCRYPGAEEVIIRSGIACTTPARTLVDLAGMLHDGALRRAVERAAVLQILEMQTLDRALAGAKRRRGVGRLRAILDDWRTEDGQAPDVRSAFEALVLPQLVAMGLPRPACNETLEIDGHRLVVDFLWQEQRLVVETDGQQVHATPIAFQRDRRRDQILLAGGYRVARTTWQQMKRERGAVVARIRGALELPGG